MMASHIHHIEDLIIYSGMRGALDTIELISSIVNHDSSIDISLKWDGAPSIFIGVDPADQRFFIAMKGIYNKKSPRIYKSVNDIKNINASKDLKDKLCACYKKYSNYSNVEVLQGDFLHDGSAKSELINEKRYYTFQPNAITYAIRDDSDLASKINDFGIAWHSAYKPGYSLKTLTYCGKPNIKNIYNVDVKRLTLTNKEKLKLNDILDRAQNILNNIPAYKLNAFKKLHAELAGTYYNATYAAYVNNIVANSRDFCRSARGYSKYLDDRLLKKCKMHDKRSQRVKCLALHESLKRFASGDTIKLIVQFQNLISTAKLTIINALNRDLKTDIKTFKRLGSGICATQHEGYVVRKGNSIYKLVNRSEFSNLNFNIVKPWSINSKKHVVLVYGRLNPPTTGHKMLIDTAIELAKNSNIRIYISHTHDSKRNPLPPDLKLAYVKHMFCDIKDYIYACNNNIRTLLDILTQLYNEGFRSITMVVGSDRSKDMEKLISSNNGVSGSHGYYKFSYNIYTAGKKRDNSGTGIESISAELARDNVRARNFEKFKLCIPINYKYVKDLYADLCKYIK